MKTRIYCNIEANFPNKPGYLIRREWDFGPVNREALGGMATFKEYSTYDWDAAIRSK